MSGKRLATAVFACGLLGFGPAAADPSSPPPDKSGYSLFHPTPPALMREFNTDRPDVTEGPFTVDAGHLQVELSFVEYTHDQDLGLRTDGVSVLPVSLRLGLRNNLDVEWLASPYQNVRTAGTGPAQRDTGPGDSEVRATLNLWGDDGGSTAFGLIPFVILPTGSGALGDHHLEGGMILPLAMKLPAGFDLGTEAEFDALRNSPDDGYGMAIVHSASFGHELAHERLGGYLEYVGVSPVSLGRRYLAYVDTGLTCASSASTQLDIGINIGLTADADDYTVFAGFSFRI